MRQRKRSLLFALFPVLLLSVMLALAQQAKQPAYVGNKNTKKYHVATCQWAGKIAPKNRVEFSSAKEAEDKGFVACKVCKPDPKKP